MRAAFGIERGERYIFSLAVFGKPVEFRLLVEPQSPGAGPVGHGGLYRLHVGEPVARDGLTQVAGRAGRGELPGRVLIQTYYPEHYAVQDAVRQDYVSFFERELHFRRMMMYPPFTSLANVIVRHTNLENATRWSRRLSEYFAPQDGKAVRILGPALAPLARLKKEHRYQFLLKSPKKSALTKILSGALAFCDANEIPQTAVLIDMDPLTLL